MRERMPERHEKKYYISASDLEGLRNRIARVLDYDPHADANGEYFIRSLYFDDVFDSAYYDKVDGAPARDKYRIRIYNMSDAVIFLERKRKAGELIQKSSVRITRELAQELINGNPTPLLKTGEPLLLEMYAEMRTKLLRAKVLVDYTREAFVHPAQNVRITFDKRLSCCPGSTDLFNKDLLSASVLDSAQEILEVKYDEYLPQFIAAVLADSSHEHCAVSKYVLCRGFEPLT
ncbi:MAG: polyphosphate polymerase domain-containing protein [Clostridia bacterium]|nr:polyphosphate polymerase domain-containing protein [Clostridia bacterium]